MQACSRHSLTRSVGAPRQRVAKLFAMEGKRRDAAKMASNGYLMKQQTVLCLLSRLQWDLAYSLE